MALCNQRFMQFIYLTVMSSPPNIYKAGSKNFLYSMYCAKMLQNSFWYLNKNFYQMWKINLLIYLVLIECLPCSWNSSEDWRCSDEQDKAL